MSVINVYDGCLVRDPGIIVVFIIIIIIIILEITGILCAITTVKILSLFIKDSYFFHQINHRT